MSQKILFVCRSNTGRSQVAAELYNMETGSQNASSAGTKVIDGFPTVKSRPNSQPMLDAAQKYGIEISNNVRQQLRAEDLEKYDKIIVMAETKNIPEWLSKHPNYEEWEIEDMKDKNTEEASKIIATIHERVKGLVSTEA